MEDLSQLFTPVKELLLSTPLKDKGLMAHDNPIILQANKSYPLALEDVTFVFGAGAEAAITLFNDEDDKDPDTQLGIEDAPLTFDTSSEAFLKYAIAISAKANGSLNVGAIGFNADLSASGNAKTSYYRKHANTENINQAFMEDISAFKTIFRFEDIQNLEVGNALGFTVNGTLNASLKMSWSNIFSQSLSSLTKQLPYPVTLDINLTPSLTASFVISVTDDFGYIVKKETADQCLISITRKKSSTTSAGTEASVGISFSQPEELATQLNEIYTGIIASLFNHSLEDIHAAIDKVKGEVDSVTQNAIVSDLLTYFRLDKVPGAIDALLNKLTTFEQNITETIKEIARANVVASFSYQYKRTDENKELLSVSIATQYLTGYHSQLLRFQPAGLLDAMRNNKFPYTLHSYINQKSLSFSHAYGFGLKLLDLVFLTSKDYSDEKDTIWSNFTGNQQITIDRTKGYQWQLGKEKGSWLGDFSATMPRYSASAIPNIKEFEFSLLLDMVTTDPKMTLNDLRSYLDSGVLWGSILPQDTDKLISQYVNAGNLISQAVSVEVKLILPDKVWKLLVQRIGSFGWNDTNIHHLATTMAASMSWLDGYQRRATPAARQATYTALWLDFLTNYDPDTDINTYGAEAEDAISQAGDGDYLSKFEGNTGNWIFGDTFAGVIRSNPELYPALKGAIDSLSSFQHLVEMQQAFDIKSFGKWIAGFTSVFSQSFYVRTLGCFFLLHANDLGITSDITKVFTLTAGSGPDARVINITAV